MIITGKIDRILTSKSESIVSFVVPNYQAKALEELNQEKSHKIEITEIKSKRSLFQNKYLWALIHEIARVQGMDEMDVYCQVIKMAKIRTEIIQTIPAAVDKLKRVFRVIIERERRTSDKGIETVILECYFGSSDFDTQEMSNFIDKLLEYAAMSGINVSEYGGFYG